MRGDDTASSTVAGAVAAVGVIFWKVSVVRGIRELGFLHARNKNLLSVQKVTKLIATVLDTVTIKLKEGVPAACEGTCTVGSLGKDFETFLCLQLHVDAHLLFRYEVSCHTKYITVMANLSLQ